MTPSFKRRTPQSGGDSTRYQRGTEGPPISALCGAGPAWAVYVIFDGSMGGNDEFA